MSKLFTPGHQFTDVNGNPVNGGGVVFYQNGTTTLKNIFIDTALSVAATNSSTTTPKGQPLDADGRFSQGDLYGSGSYTVVLFDSTGATIWSRDDYLVLDSVANTTTYELGSTAAAQSHPGISTWHIIKTNYIDSVRTSGSGSDVRYTGTTTVGKAGNWPDADGFFYDADGKQFSLNSTIKDVRKYGARLNGSTDDLAAGTASIAALSEGDTWLVSGGNMSVSDSLTFTSKDDIELMASGNGKITQTGTGRRTINLVTCNNVKVQGFHLVGKGIEIPTGSPTSSTGTGVAGIHMTDCTYMEVYKNTLTNHAGGGIRWLTSSVANQHFKIHDNTVAGMGSGVITDVTWNMTDVGIGSGGSAADELEMNIYDNDVHGHIFGILGADNGAGSWSIKDNSVHDIPGQHAIYADPISNAIISGNRVDGAGLNGIKVQIRKVIASGTDAERLHITDNIVLDAGDMGIQVIGNQTYVITAFADGGGGKVVVTSAAHGRSNNDEIVIIGTTNYNATEVISNVTTNTFEITATWVSDDATGTFTTSNFFRNIDISGNTISTTTLSGTSGGNTPSGSRGMQIQECRKVRVTNNSIFDSSGYGVRMVLCEGIFENNLIYKSELNGLQCTVSPGGEISYKNNTFIDCALNTGSAGAGTTVDYWVDMIASTTGTAKVYFGDNLYRRIAALGGQVDNNIRFVAGTTSMNAYDLGGEQNMLSVSPLMSTNVTMATGTHGNPQSTYQTITTLTTSQVNNLRATPITLVAARGAGTLLEFVSAQLFYNYSTTAFTVAADEDFVIQYDASTDVSASIESAGFIDQTNDEIRWVRPTWTESVDMTALVNKKIEIFNTGAGETAGGGASTIKVICNFRVHHTGL